MCVYAHIYIYREREGENSTCTQLLIDICIFFPERKKEIYSFRGSDVNTSLIGVEQKFNVVKVVLKQFKIVTN